MLGRFSFSLMNMDELAQPLAAAARRLGLSALNVQQADDETVREFAALVLEELAARGLVEGEEEVGCWAQERFGGN